MSFLIPILLLSASVVVAIFACVQGLLWYRFCKKTLKLPLQVEEYKQLAKDKREAKDLFLFFGCYSIVIVLVILIMFNSGVDNV